MLQKIELIEIIDLGSFKNYSSTSFVSDNKAILSETEITVQINGKLAHR